MRNDIKERVKQMQSDGVKINYAEMARTMNCDYRTVKRYFENKDSQKERPRKPSKLDPYKEIIQDKLDLKCTKMSIFKFIQKRGYKGGYSILGEFARKYVTEETKKATIRFETIPGLQAQVDWKEEKVLHTKSGEEVKFNVFLMISGYSRKKYLELTLDRSQDTLKKAMINAFEYFEGVPKEIIFDNMKTVVDQSKTQYQNVVINENFYHFSRDIGFEVWACRPYRPQTKGKVEALAKLTNRLDPYDFEFDDIDELGRIVSEVRDDLNNEFSRAIHDTPNNRWQTEKEYFLPLPIQDVLDTYLTFPHTRKVTKESMIVYNNRKYSLPTDYIGKIVEVKENNDILYILDKGIVIEEHKISDKPFNYKEDHIVDILNSDAMKDKTSEEIEDFAKKQLQLYDSLGG